MEHCKRKIKPYDIWYLFDNRDFHSRILKLGKCPVCNKPLAMLIETRKTDNKAFIQFETGKMAERLADLNRGNINYSRLEIKIKHCKCTMPKSIRYGENKIVKRGGKEFLRQNAVSSINGKKELIKDIPVETMKSYAIV